MSNTTKVPAPWMRLLTLARRQPEVLLGLGLIGVLLVILVPLPSTVVDPLLIFNVTISLLILMTSAAVLKPLEFSVFPSLLLIVTFFRLGLNIATTRLILGNAVAGPQAAGKVVATFGSFVGGDNLVVGLVVFTVIVVVQFVVITRGATRVSEVAARFQLDAMPGKQLSIDNDLAAGAIDQETGRKRRLEVAHEADFYGTMDGASKFVRGDAVAGLLIILVNLVGGALLGVFRYGMGLGEALSVFGRLTIGDGLVSQVPALMVSISAALLVTRSNASERLGHDLGRQLFSNERVLFIAAFFLLALTPTGLPIPALLLTSAACVTGGLVLRRSNQAAESVDEPLQVEARMLPELPEPPEEKTREGVDARALLEVEVLELEVGYRLVSLLSDGSSGGLLSRLASMRRRAALEIGLVVPSIKVGDSTRLRGTEYSLRLRGNPLGTWKLVPNGFLAVGESFEGKEDHSLRFLRGETGGRSGVDLEDPLVLGALQGRWIPRDEAREAVDVGCEILGPGEGLALHIESLVKAHAAEVLSREEVSNRVETLRERAPGLVEDLIPRVVSLGDLHRTLQDLLREGVSIRDLESILEALSEAAGQSTGSQSSGPEARLAAVRTSLGRSICSSVTSSDGRLYTLLLDPALDEFIQGSLTSLGREKVLALDPQTVDLISESTAESLHALTSRGRRPVIVCAPVIRRQFWKLVRKRVPEVVVLSYEEILEEFAVEVQGSVSLDRLGQTPAARQEIGSEG